jgi:signal transduction histidine kinase
VYGVVSLPRPWKDRLTTHSEGVVGSSPMSAPVHPGPATSSRGGRSLLVAFALSPVSPSSWKALAAILLGFIFSVTAFAIVTSLLSGGAGLLVVLIGIPLIALAVETARLYARIEVWRMSLVGDGPLIQRPHRPLELLDGSPIEVRLRRWFETIFLDAARWYDMAYVAVSFPLAIIEFTVAVLLWTMATAMVLVPPLVALAHAGGARMALWGNLNPYAVLTFVFLVGLILLPVAASTTRGMAVLHRYVVEGLLCISPAEALRGENERLRESRSAAVELEASELRRIERDLHDGAQQRLVMLAIDLSLAEDKLADDPAGAKTLIAGARDQARQALAEIREVVRGIAPAILVDRGLVAALGAVAGRSAVPVYVDSDLAVGERLSHAVERAAYYVVSEALANVGKHASATRIEVTLRRQPTRLGVWVRDDGQGGATIAQGGGLAGLRDRVAALDGKLLLHSPVGGPTILHVELPLVAMGHATLSAPQRPPSSVSAQSVSTPVPSAPGSPPSAPPPSSLPPQPPAPYR